MHPARMSAGWDVWNQAFGTYIPVWRVGVRIICMCHENGSRSKVNHSVRV